MAGRTRVLAWNVVAYAVAGAVAWGAWHAARSLGPVLSVAVADVAATVAVFLFSVMRNNTSMYDPYWSLAPIPIVVVWAVEAGTLLTPRTVLVVVLVSLWGLRLTFNCFRRWTDIAHEDWRYHDFRATAGRAYWLVSFAGFHAMPTVVVFLGCLAFIPAVIQPAHPFGVVDIAATLVTGLAIALEALADRQLSRFLRMNRSPGTLLQTGVWGMCRHPNYTGEVLFWWGLYLFGVAAAPSLWWTVAGPVAMTALFVGISVPMMDRRMLKRYPAYAARMATSFGIVPWPRRRRGTGG